VAFVVFSAYSYLNHRILNLTVAELNSGPHKNLVHAQTFIGPPLLGIFVLVIYYIRNVRMRKCIYRELKERWTRA
jgi:hypothetical protein